MELNYVLIFIIGFMSGGISLFAYHYKKINNLRADITDKKIINKLIKEYVAQLPGNKKRRYNGKQKTKKTSTASRQNAKQSG